jgi:hypothetical protein
MASIMCKVFRLQQFVIFVNSVIVANKISFWQKTAEAIINKGGLRRRTRQPSRQVGKFYSVCFEGKGSA